MRSNRSEMVFKVHSLEAYLMVPSLVIIDRK